MRWPGDFTVKYLKVAVLLLLWSIFSVSILSKWSLNTYWSGTWSVTFMFLICALALFQSVLYFAYGSTFPINFEILQIFYKFDIVFHIQCGVLFSIPLRTELRGVEMRWLIIGSDVFLAQSDAEPMNLSMRSFFVAKLHVEGQFQNFWIHRTFVKVPQFHSYVIFCQSFLSLDMRAMLFDPLPCCVLDIHILSHWQSVYSILCAFSSEYWILLYVPRFVLFLHLPSSFQ